MGVQAGIVGAGWRRVELFEVADGDGGGQSVVSQSKVGGGGSARVP